MTARPSPIEAMAPWVLAEDMLEPLLVLDYNRFRMYLMVCVDKQWYDYYQPVRERTASVAYQMLLDRCQS